MFVCLFVCLFVCVCVCVCVCVRARAHSRTLRACVCLESSLRTVYFNYYLLLVSLNNTLYVSP